jgi:hypothetical protein
MTDIDFDTFAAARAVVLLNKAKNQRSVRVYDGEIAAWASRLERISIVD